MKRFFFLLLCIAALGACSDDETADPKPAVVGDVQFAAAIDPLAAESRVIQDGTTTSWEAGDRIGITAMIDGTPHIENVPYTLSAATTFSELTPFDEAIRWNESVRGRRTYFAYYPYDESNAGGLLNRAVVRFGIPAEQTVEQGVNTTRPFLIGEAATDAAQQKPIALRFRNFASVLELRFEAFAETSVASVTISPAEGSPLTGWIAGEGTTDNLGNLTLTKQSDRLTVTCTGEGLPLDAARSIRIPLGRFTTGDGGLMLTVVTTDERTFSEVLFAGENFSSCVTDGQGAFVKAKYITHTMKMEVISDEPREVYFSDDFSWITPSDRWSTFTPGGWPTLSASGSPTGKANVFTLDLLPEFASIGYTTSNAYRTSVQARYEGYVGLGISSKRAALTTPAIEKAGATPTNLLVSFYGALYASAGKVPDTAPLVISVDGPGTIGDTGESSTEVAINNVFGWRKYWVIVKGATAQTRIVFGKDEDLANARTFIDNILIGKAVKGAVAGSRDVVVPVEPQVWTVGEDKADIENLTGAEVSLMVQANTAWTATTDADWLAFSPQNEALGAGIPYVIKFRALTQNKTGAPRTAVINVTAAGDQVTKTLTITQTGEIPEFTYLKDDFEWTAGDGTIGNILTGEYTSSTTIGTNGTKWDKWSAAYLAYGWTSVSKYLYAKSGVLGLGIQGTPGDMVSPALTKVGATPTDIVVEFDVLEYKHASETGKSVFTVQGPGTIAAITGNYTAVANDTYTGISADGKSCNYYCGDYKDWTNGAQWHHIVVTVTGATSQTKVGVAGLAGFCRFWIDNFKVTPKE